MEENTLRFPHLFEVLQRYGERSRDLYREKLTQEGKNASKELFNSVTFEVRTEGSHFQVGLNLAFYWRFVEGGTKGKKYPDALCRQHFPPLAPIARWIEVKPIVPRPDKNGKIPKPSQLAFLIGRKIARDGIKPAPVFAQTSEQVYKEFSDKVAEAFFEDVGNSMELIMTPLSGLNTKA